MKIIKYITAALYFGLLFSCTEQDGFQGYHLDNLESICLPTELISLASQSDVDPTRFSDILVSLNLTKNNANKNGVKELDINVQGKSSTNKSELYSELLESIRTNKIEPTFNSELDLYVVPSAKSTFGWHYIERAAGSTTAEIKIDNNTYVAFCPDVAVNGLCFITQVVDDISFSYQLNENQMHSWKELSADLASKFESWISCEELR